MRPKLTIIVAAVAGLVLIAFFLGRGTAGGRKYVQVVTVPAAPAPPARVQPQVKDFTIKPADAPKLAKLQPIAFELGQTEFAHADAGDSIVIEQVKSSAGGFKEGEIIEVIGSYKLASRDSASLSLYITATRREDGVSVVDPQQQTTVKKGEGRFTLRARYVPGYPHVSFYNGGNFGGVYFGSGEALLRKKA